MERPKVLVTHAHVPEIALKRLRERCDLIFNEEYPCPNETEIASKVKGVDAILFASRRTLSKEMIDAAGPQLKVVATVSSGTNNIDTAYLKLKQIKFHNVLGVSDKQVAECAILLALAVGRRIREGRKSIENGTWHYLMENALLGIEMNNSKVGIVGFGGIGASIAKKCVGFEVDEILYTGHTAKESAKQFGARHVDFETLVTESDFVFISCPLTAETENLFDRKTFAKMKRTAILVNIARGAIINQTDLIEALENGIIFGAGLDVMTPEPLPTDHELLKLDNCVLTPHTGTITKTCLEKMALTCVDYILKGLNV